MKKANQLYDLIQSLTKNEKRYFKICAAKHVIGGKNNYVKLFDYIAGQKEYNEEAIKVKFKNENFIKRLSAAKYDLYHLILKSLNEYHQGKSIKFLLRDGLNSIQVLMDKALYSHCLKLIQTNKSLAYKFDEFQYVLEILEEERKAIRKMGSGVEMKEEIEKINEESIAIQERLNRIGEFVRIGAEVQKLVNQFGRPRNDEEMAQFTAIIDNDAWRFPEDELTNKEKVQCFMAKSLYYYAIREQEKSYQYSKKRVEIYEEHADVISDHGTYLGALYNLEVTANSIKKYDESQAVRQRIKAFAERFPDKLTVNNQVQIFKSLNNELIYYTDTVQFEKGIALVDDLYAGMEALKGKLGRSDEIILLYNITILYLYADKPHIAIKWLNKLLNHPSATYREDIYSFSRIINLIIHFELGNFDVLPYYVRSTYRFLEKANRKFKVEEAIVNFIRKKQPYIAEGDKVKTRAAFKELLDQILTFIEEPDEMGCLDYFNIVSWLESKVENKSYKEVYTERYLKEFNEC